MRTFCLALLLFSPAVLAADASAGDTAWVLTATALVLFMTLPGLALFYGGLVRAKNVLSVLMQCFTITAVVSLLWLAYGYSLAFAPGNGFIGGLSKAMFAGVGEDAVSGSIPETAFALFQLTFAVITPALVIGAFAERMRFAAMLLFSCLWFTLVYLPICHWVWASDGWLFTRGLLDFAGGTVVHISAGVAALVAALVLGHRNGFPATMMPPHNMTMTVTGAGMLWVGWFGFNGGSALAANGNAAMAMLVTHISAAAGAVAWSALEWSRFRKPSALGLVTGMVAGLGTITPASGTVGPGGALLIGLIAGCVCFFATQAVKRVFKVDDSLDVFPVHGVGGIIGTLMTGLFTSASLGVFSGQGYAAGQTMSGQLAVQALGVAATIGYTAVMTWVVLRIVAVVATLRVTLEQEHAGLDNTDHNETGYNL
jgi:Amt family ammonium transporter